MKVLTNLIPSRVACIPIRGPINSQMTDQVTVLLDKVPRNVKALSAIISSNTGCFSQALIIAQKLKAKAKERNIQLYTFGEQFAVNSGFLLLMAGEKVFIDHTTIIGGLKNGESKIRLGDLAKYFRQVSYSLNPNLATQLTSDESFSANKKQEMQEIFEGFSNESAAILRSLRNGKVKQQTNLNDLFIGKQAQELGLIDGIGRFNQTLNHKFPQANIKIIKQNMLLKLKDDLLKALPS